jgi:ribosomal protein S19
MRLRFSSLTVNTKGNDRVVTAAQDKAVNKTANSLFVALPSYVTKIISLTNGKETVRFSLK